MSKQLIRVLFTNKSDGSNDYIDDVLNVQVKVLKCGTIVWDLIRLDNNNITLVSHYHQVNFIEV